MPVVDEQQRTDGGKDGDGANASERDGDGENGRLHVS